MTTKATKPDFTTIEVLARMTSTPIECKDLCDKWLLLTYDIPHTDKGDKARRAFLSSARMVGATRHTDSVYLMPWTRTAEVLALELARAGEVFVWTSQTTNEKKAAQITESYDQSMRPMLDEIEERIDRIDFHLDKKRFKRAKKMMDKTELMVNSTRDAIIRRGSAELYIQVVLLERRFNALLV